MTYFKKIDENRFLNIKVPSGKSWHFFQQEVQSLHDIGAEIIWINA